MKILKTTIVLLLLITNINTYAQDYFIVKQDTTFCSDLKYSTTSQGYLKAIEYTDADGKTVLIKGRKNVPDVITFYIRYSTIDKIPLKADKPDGYIRYTKRMVDGKLKVYLAQQSTTSTITYTPGAPSGDWNTGSARGSYRFFIKMPDGTYYKINSKSNLKKYIKPYLLQCEEFEKQYKGSFSTREWPFMEMIKLYNSLCE